MNKKITKYLTGDPLPWLLDTDNLPVRYITLRDLYKDNDPGTEYPKLETSPEITALINNSKNNILGDTVNFDIYYKGTFWYFCQAVAMGLDRKSEIIRSTAQYLTDNCQMPSGGFTLNWTPRKESAAISGTIANYMLQAGIHNQSTDKTIAWIQSIQREDGGWRFSPLKGFLDLTKLILFKKSGNGTRLEQDRSIASCPFATIACANTLLLYKQLYNSKKMDALLQKAADFFLAMDVFKPLPNTRFSMVANSNNDFTRPGFPVMTQYDITTGLIFLAAMGRQNTTQFSRAFNLLMSAQNQDGTWNLGNISNGMMFGKGGKHLLNKKNKWVTLNVLRLLYILEDQ